MKALLLNGPNRGVLHIDRIGHTLKVMDPTERVGSYKVGDMDPLKPIKVNTYFWVPLHPFAEAYGFSALFRFSHTNV
jgi:hypothetical protein